MKPFLSFLLTLLIGTSALAKKERPTLAQLTITDTIVAGKFMNVDSTPVLARQYTFPFSVYKIDPDSNDNLTIILREKKGDSYRLKGYMSSFDVENGSIIWAKGIANYSLKFTRDILLYTGTNSDQGIGGYSKYTGERLYTNGYNNFISTNWEHSLGLTTQHRLVDLKTNTSLWQRKVKDGLAVEDIVWLGDTTILLAANGIHNFSIATGEGWTYRSKTGREDYTKTAVMAGVGIASALLTGFAVIPTGSDQITGYSSNILTDSAGYHYFYSLQALVKLTSDGKEIWSVPSVPEDPANSILYDAGERIILVNTGVVLYNGQPTRRGKAFVAAYNKKTGKELFKTYPDNKKVLFLQHVVEDTLMINMAGRLISYSTKTGKVIAFEPERKKGDTTQTKIAINGALARIKLADGSYRRLDKLYPGAFFFENSRGLIVLNANLKEVATINNATVWAQELDMAGESLLSMGNNWVKLVDGMPTAEISGLGKGVIMGKNLVFINGRKMTVLDWTVL